ncbi:uncharacterized protein LOC123318262 [Coccinella septempunctata]|uniref:uncharacterized protein LOC123318262 n=1 Tax=Coccinella septempunctata TaxID=41139 RepID=UPI001D085677|nr:uncharacterized protein LOC123318262 [Coccinella septempunctata]
MMDTEKFIKCVKNNPTIWKKNSKGYGDRVMRESCWNLIGQHMFDSWDEKTEEERHEEVINMKNKWRHMRDSFNKYINQGKGRFSGVKKRRYIYADNLSFLLQRGSRIARESQEEEVKPSFTNQDITDQEISERTQPKPQTVGKKIPVRLQERTNNIPKYHLIKNPASQTSPEDDPDRCYLLSLLPEFRKLNDDQKLDFRFHTLQFFRVIRTKMLTRRPQVVNGWSEEMECEVDNPQSYAASPRGSQNSSPPNSPGASPRSDHSASATHFESVKAELI